MLKPYSLSFIASILFANFSAIASPPTISWLCPDNNTAFFQGEIITLQATIVEPLTTIQKAEFFDGSSKIGESLIAPFRFSWRGASVGSHAITIKVINLSNENSTTSARNFTVNAFALGANNIISWDFNGTVESTAKQGWIDTNLDGNDWKWKPSDGVNGTGGWFHSLVKPLNYIASPAVAMKSGVTYTVSFAARQANSPSLRQIRCAMGTSQNRANITDIGIFELPGGGYNVPPYVTYNPTFTPTVSGNYHVVFYVDDAFGGYHDSFIDDVLVERTIFPTGSVINPLNNATFVENDITGTDFNFNFLTNDSDGQVKKLELFQNGKSVLNLLKSFNDTTWVMSRVLPGDYNYVAKITDDQGNVTISDTVRTKMNFSDGTLTKYIHWNFDGATQEVVFNNWKFNDTGLGDWRFRGGGGWQNSNHAEAFQSGSKSFMASQGMYLTAGLSYKLSFKANPQNENTKLRFSYNTFPALGGTLIKEINLPNTSPNPNGRDNFQTHFTQNFQVTTSGLYYLVISTPTTTAGINQNQIKFDEIRIAGNLNIAPLTKFTYPTTTIYAAENSKVLLKGTAVDSDGTVNKVEFFDGVTKLGEDSSLPYEYRWNKLPLGSRTVQLRGVDNENVGDSTVKMTVNVLPSQFSVASFLGGTGDDDIRGMVIQADGTVVIAANLANSFTTGVLPQTLLGNATAASEGCILRISRDGRQVLSVTRLAAKVVDLSSDNLDNLYVAAGIDGAIKLNPQANQIIWQNVFTPRYTQKIDAGPLGYSAILLTGESDPDDQTWGSSLGIRIFNPTGILLGEAGGASQYGSDVAIDEVSQTVVSLGFKNVQAQTTTGRLPVYIPVVKGHNYDGTLKYNAYDWEADSNMVMNGVTVQNPRYINRTNNNMADARAYRAEMGQDGKLYILHEVSGGNHLFRYAPFNISQSVPIVGGDNYFNFANTGTEVKIVLTKHNPSDFSYIQAQQLTNRLPPPLNKGNTIFARYSGLAADSTGRVYITGESAYGLPVTLDYQPGEYTGGAYIYVLSPNFQTREICTRLASNGKGRALAVRSRTNWGFAGNTDQQTMYLQKPMQKTVGGLNDGFLVLKSTATCGTMTSIKSGNWNDPSVWSCDRIPMFDDNVVISPTHTVTIPATFKADGFNLTIKGILQKLSTSGLNFNKE